MNLQRRSTYINIVDLLLGLTAAIGIFLIFLFILIIVTLYPNDFFSDQTAIEIGISAIFCFLINSSLMVLRAKLYKVKELEE
ncbi:MAG: hypothetical protein ACTSUR_08440 [Candidatus Heimdallarchaeaceae archaeon]